MSSKLLLLFILFCSLRSTAQISLTPSKKDTIIYVAGKELYKFHNDMSTGYGLELTGLVLAAVGSTSNKRSSPLIILGGVCGLVGLYKLITASEHVGNAGKLLMALSGTPIEIKHKKKRK